MYHVFVFSGAHIDMGPIGPHGPQEGEGAPPIGPGPALVWALGPHWFETRARIGLGPRPALVRAPGPHWFGPWARIGLGPGPALVALVGPFRALGPKMVAVKALKGFLVPTWTRKSSPERLRWVPEAGEPVFRGFFRV